MRKLRTANRNAMSSRNSRKAITFVSRFRSSLFMLAALAGMAFVMQACSGNVAYDTFNHTQLAGWDKADTLFFGVPPLRESGIYKPSVGLRINENFPFTSVTLVVDYIVEPEHRACSDTLWCRLIDNKGNTLGRGVSYYQFDFTGSELRLDKGDSLHVGIRHIMKRELLPGVADVGLRLSLIR